MLFLCKRVTADVLRMAGWIAAIAVLTMTCVAVFNATAPFVAYYRTIGYYTLTQPHDELSFVRVLDPARTIYQDVTASATQDHAVGVMLDYVARSDNMHIVVSLADVDPSIDSLGGTGGSQVIVGSIPGVSLPEVPPTQALIWGTFPRERGNASLAHDPASIAGIGLRRISEDGLDASIVDGSGSTIPRSSAVTILMSVEQFRASSPRFLDVTGLVQSLTCYCEADQLSEMTDAMNAADTGRLFLPVSYDYVRGALEGSYALTEVWLVASTGAALLTSLSLALLARRALWKIRANHYRIDIMAGAGALGMHVRSQVPLLMCLAGPALLAQAMMYVWSLPVDFPPPLAPEFYLAAVLGILSVHAAIGSVTAYRIHRLYMAPQERVHRD